MSENAEEAAPMLTTISMKEANILNISWSLHSLKAVKWVH